MNDEPVPQVEDIREPTQEEEVLRLMYAGDRQLYQSPDVSDAQKQAVFDFYLKKLKEGRSHPQQNEAAASPSERMSNVLQIDPRAIDAQYDSFPPFSTWANAIVDVVRWNDHIKTLGADGESSAGLLRRARDVVTRAAAIDTGALEHLYEVDKGFTFTVATQAATWEATLNKKGPEVRALIESQMEAYEMVLDFATKKQPVAEAWIRELHREICKSQDTYSALTEVGWQELKLPLGQYKVSPNHVHGRDGKIHAYAPVDRTPSEMQRLMEELRSNEFTAAHPVLQASYAHYAFVLIHPFADGNGRVARALASVYTYRAESIPLLILSENRNDYIDSLTAADAGDFQLFVNFILERALDAIRLTKTSLLAASVSSIEDALKSYKSVYVTKGGYTHEQVDRAGYALVDLVTDELNKQALLIKESTTIQVEIGRENNPDYNLTLPENMRLPITESGRRLIIQLTGAAEADHPRINFSLYLAVPRNSDREDEILLTAPEVDLSFSARINELVPTQSAALQLRVLMFAQAVLGLALDGLTYAARSNLKRRGFIS